MGRPTRYKVTLTQEERSLLTGISTKGRDTARRVRFARALLLLDEGEFAEARWKVDTVSIAIGCSDLISISSISFSKNVPPRKILPIAGKRAKKFANRSEKRQKSSNHWKNFFQSLENSHFSGEPPDWPKPGCLLQVGEPSLGIRVWSHVPPPADCSSRR